MKGFYLAVICAALFLFAGCAGYPVHSWKQGQAAVDLGPQNQRFCFLTRVSGHFEGGGEKVRVYQKNGRWWLGGGSMQKGVGGTAVCINRALFSASGKFVRWASSDFQAEYEEDSTGLWPLGGCLAGIEHGENNAWYGDAATAISGISGKFSGGAEQVLIKQSANPEESSRVITTTQQCNVTMRGWATSFFVGVPHSNSLPVFIGPSGEGTVLDAGEYAVDTAKGPSAVRMASYKQSVCYFTWIDGKFRSGADYVEIYAAKTGATQKSWFMEAHTGNLDGVRARARCLKIHQP